MLFVSFPRFLITTETGQSLFAIWVKLLLTPVETIEAIITLLRLENQRSEQIEYEVDQTSWKLNWSKMFYIRLDNKSHSTQNVVVKLIKTLVFGQLPTHLPLRQAKGNIQNPHKMIQAHTSDQLNLPDNSSDLQYTCPNTKRAT